MDRFPGDVTTRPVWLCRWSVFHFKIINNLFNTEFPIRIITITTTSAISSGLKPQSPPDRLYYNISPSHSSSVYSRGEYKTLKRRSESIVYGNSIHNRKKINTLMISAKACSLIFFLWEITRKKDASLSSTKEAALTAHLAHFVTSREIGLLAGTILGKQPQVHVREATSVADWEYLYIQCHLLSHFWHVAKSEF